jgi:hypothetical protein
MSIMWMPVSDFEIANIDASTAPLSLLVMFSTMLTKRRAVDHCRVHSSLCRMS